MLIEKKVPNFNDSMIIVLRTYLNKKKIYFGKIDK